MEKILVLLHDIDVKRLKSDTDKSRDKFEYLGSLFHSLIEIIKIEDSIKSNHAKCIMLESFCFNTKRILDQYKLEFKDSIYFNELKKVRNILAHDIITYQVNNNGIVFNNHEKGMETRYHHYYSNTEGAISISRFMLYHTHLLVREFSKIIPKEKYTGINISSKDIADGIRILSEYEMILDTVHDKYIEITSPVYIQPKNSINTDHKEYIDKCKVALSWIKGQESTFPIDYMHINISLTIFSKEFDDTIYYSNKSEDIIKEIEPDYPYVSIYLLHIYAGLSKVYFNKKEKRCALLYALKSINLCNRIPVKLLDKIIYYVNLANSYSLYGSPRECQVLLRCFNMLDEAGKDKYKNIDEYQFMVLGNLIDSFSLHKRVIPDNCISLFLNIYKSELKKNIKNDFKKKVIKYYISVNEYSEAASLIAELVDKNIVVGNEKLSWKLIQLNIMYSQGKSVLEEFNIIEKKVKKLKTTSDEEKYIYQQYISLKERI